MSEYMSPEDKINTIKQEGNRDVIYEIMMREIRAAPAEQERILKEWATASEAVKNLRITAHVKDVANELLEIIDGLQMEMEASGRFSQSPSPIAVRRSRSPVRRRRSLGLSGSPTNTRHRSRSRRSSSNRVVRRGGKTMKRKTMKKGKTIKRK